MADFSFISESDESAVEDIISQAMDHCVLEQIVSLNSSGISDSVLPTDIETRFSKLKSFPGAHPNPKTKPPSKIHKGTSSDQFSEKPIPSKNEEIGSTEPNMNQVKTSPKKKLKQKSRSGYINSPSSSSSSDSDSDSGSERGGSSPPRQACCFWSPPPKKGKKVGKKKKKETRVLGSGFEPFDWEKDDEIIRDFTTLSMKEEKKKLKKAMKEQEKINREAEKIVEWAKQVSARIDVSAVEDLLSDEEKSE